MGQVNGQTIHTELKTPLTKTFSGCFLKHTNTIYNNNNNPTVFFYKLSMYLIHTNNDEIFVKM